MPEWVRPTLYTKQEEAIFTPKRWALIEASTKSGKTVGCIVWIIEQALRGGSGQNYWWVAPGYNQADIAFRRIKAYLTKGTFTPYESPQPRIVLLTGATIWFKSAENTDGLYGEDVYAAVIDEASRMREEAWHAIRSTLTATRGPARIIGNVKGRKNWFFTMARRAEDGDSEMHYAKITADDAVEAGVLAGDEIEDARRNLPEMVFRELYMAEAGDDGGNPFGIDHIRRCIIPTLGEGPTVAFGIDLAKVRDWFVVIGLNGAGLVSSFHRWRGVPWEISEERCHEIVGSVPALVDSTGVGDPVLESLRKGHKNFQGYHFTQPSKMRLVEGLIVGIQSHDILYPDGQIRNELENFEYETTRTGIRYEAAVGCHDDCVMSLALAWRQLAKGQVLAKFEAANTWVPKPINIYAR